MSSCGGVHPWATATLCPCTPAESLWTSTFKFCEATKPRMMTVQWLPGSVAHSQHRMSLLGREIGSHSWIPFTSLTTPLYHPNSWSPDTREERRGQGTRSTRVTGCFWPSRQRVLPIVRSEMTETQTHFSPPIFCPYLLQILLHGILTVPQKSHRYF